MRDAQGRARLVGSLEDKGQPAEPSPPNRSQARLSPNFSSPLPATVPTDPLMDDPLNWRVVQGQQGVGEVVLGWEGPENVCR